MGQQRPEGAIIEQLQHRLTASQKGLDMERALLKMGMQLGTLMDKVNSIQQAVVASED